MTRSDEQAIRNEQRFREANERIREAREKLPFADERVPFLCECEEERCTEILLVPLAEYEKIRAAEHFLLAADHPHRGSVVGEGDGWQVVEKG